MSHVKIVLTHAFNDGVDTRFKLQVDLQLPNTVTALFGESGAGKTTLLRAVAGLEKVSNARISVGDEVWQNESYCLPTHKRQLAYVFQRAGLFPHLTVEDNIAYAAKRAVQLKGKEHSANEKQALYDLLNIRGLLQRMPDKLSGGEQQRVAIARAMTHRPTLLLLDEPLASLDQARKEEVLPYLEALCTELNIPALYVSHSLNEVSRLASHIVVLNDGKVAAQGEITEVLNQPGMVTGLGIEHAVILDAVIEQTDIEWGLATARFSGGTLQIGSEQLSDRSRFRIRLNARDVSITLSPPSDSSILNVLPARISALLPGPSASSCLVQLQLHDELSASGTSFSEANLMQTTIGALITKKSLSALQLEIGQCVWAQVKSVAVVR